MNYEKFKYHIWLNAELDGDSESANKLASYFGTPENVFNADPHEYYRVKGISDETADILFDKNLEKAEEIIEFCRKYNVRIIASDEDDYPERLKFLFTPPFILYAMGEEIDIDDNVLIATVGTRSCTDYGKKAAYKIAYELAKQGAIVVSGLAEGIDAVTHQAAIDAGGKTIAVLGSGLATAYPKSNRELYKKILATGGELLTEYPPFSPPDKTHFPIRNRIISGISLTAVIMESHYRSGALITARHAIQQGKSVYAVPAKIDDYAGSGNLQLIKDGARIVTCGMDVLEEFELLYAHRVKIDRKIKAPLPLDNVHTEVVKTFKSEEVNKSGEIPQDIYEKLSPTGKKIADLLKQKPMTTDALAQSGIQLDDLLTQLTLMEISGVIKAEAGGIFRLNY